MLWHEQSWPTIQSLDKNMPVIVPLGSIEQHGHHLPVVVDTQLVTAVAESAESAMADQVLLLPTLWLGCSHHHKDFPGTITVLPSLYAQNIKSIAASILRAGFKKIMFLNGHGGNILPASHALTELVNEDDDADDAYLAFSSWWQVGSEAITPEKHGMVTPHVTHAAEYETSLMLALRPELVNMELAKDLDKVFNSDWASLEGGSKVSIFRRFRRFTPYGNLQKPRASTPQKGQSMLDAVQTDVVTFLKEMITWPELPVLGPKGP